MDFYWFFDYDDGLRELANVRMARREAGSAEVVAPMRQSGDTVALKFEAAARVRAARHPKCGCGLKWRELPLKSLV